MNKRKIASNAFLVSLNIFIGTLFLTLMIPDKDYNESVAIDNNNTIKMADSVSNLFLEEDKTSTLLSEQVNTEEENNYVSEEIVSESLVIEENTYEETNYQNEIEIWTPGESANYEAIETYEGVLTGYGPDCVGCSGISYSGYDVSNTITYNDYEYGNIRIVAADPSFELYSIIRISNVPNMDPIVAIVLDRGGTVGFNRLTLFDLLYESEAVSLGKTYGVKFEVLRRGA